VHPERVITPSRPRVACEDALSLVARQGSKDFFSRDADSQTPEPILNDTCGQCTFSTKNQAYPFDDCRLAGTPDHTNSHSAPLFLILSSFLILLLRAADVCR
jgi:hypothetical protein